MRWRLSLTGVLALGALVGASAVTRQARSAPTPRPVASPIQHIVIVYQENHSFDDVLGKLCILDSRCDGATTGRLHDGTTIPLSQEPDIVPQMGHGPPAQRTAINGGTMDGWDLIEGCSQARGYTCFTQFDPSHIPNLAALARNFVISDRTFEYG